MSLRSGCTSREAAAAPTLREPGAGPARNHRFRLLGNVLAAKGCADRRVAGAGGDGTAPTYDAHFTSDRALVRVARRAAAGYAEALERFDGDALCEIELAVGEALANAVEHAQCDGGCISLACESHGDALQVTIRDSGRGFDPQTLADAGPASERGYGIRIMRRTMDRVDFLGGGTTVTMVKHFSIAPVTAVRISA